MTASLRVRDVLRDYFASQGLPENGGVELVWVRVKVGPIPIAFPNWNARRATVRFHDVHHLVTGYQTDWVGEAEIGAWEIAAGCGRHWVAWMFNLSALSWGAFLWPRRTFVAWVRGRNCDSLYREDYEPLLDERIDELRTRLRLDRAVPAATFADRLSYWWWVFVGLTATALAPLAALVWLVSLVV